MVSKKITHRYFNEDYWTNKTRSGYNLANYNADDYQHEAKADLLISVLGSGGTWLEVGCAYGWVVHELVKKGVDACGFDISKYSTDRSPKEIRDRIVCSDGLKYNLYTENAFDVVFSFETAEHVAQKDCMLWLSNLSQWLKPGGILFMTICLGHNNIRGFDDNDLSHQTLQPREWWENRLTIVSTVKNEELQEQAMNTIVCTDHMKRFHGQENLLEKYDMNLFVRTKV